MNTKIPEIGIYVACLAAYNNGVLHGRWIDAAQGEEHVREEIDRMLHSSPVPCAEEYAIHDFEGFEGARIEEYSGVSEVCFLAEFIAEHGALGGKLLQHFGDLASARKALEEHYAGCHTSVAEFAQEITEQTTAIPEALRYYIDWRAMARDMEINDILAIETSFEEIHIFWNH